ncbi:uncharacterized protein BDW70DRAFT_143054 [Aspergillus foveolatus]|uniref:uncharacterized protein n=1 Tax=Aspergillus foveolatus TaxID=210207 RepID=UPI003CCCA01D
MSVKQPAELYSHLEGGKQLAITSVHLVNQDLPLVDRLIEPQTIAHFFSACGHGTLPNGKAISLELLKDTELELLHRSPTTDNDERDIITRVMSRIGSIEDEARMCIVGRNIWSVKNRIWAGIIPLSEQRWKEKGLDQPDNFDTAAQYLSAVVAVFEYLNRPKVQENIRDTFNLISQHWGEFETIVNAERGEGQPHVNMRQLWTEYIRAHFEVITERAHRWVLVHVNALREPLIRDLVTYRPADLDNPDRVQWKITDRLHILAEIAGVADYTIMLPMHGYYGYTAPPIPEGVLPSLRSPKWDVRCKAYGPYMKKISRIQQAQNIIDRREREGHVEYHVADPVQFQRTTEIQLGCQHRARREIRGEPVEPVPKEPWITDVLYWMKTDEHRVGFVVYRLTYGQTEADWNAFRERFEAHLSDWGSGHTGSAALKPHLALHWRDGKELGIPEDDVEAAKKHYLDTYTDSADHPLTLLDHINQRAFLAVDTPSYASYTTSTYTASTSYVLPGDFTGFILAVDPEFDPKEGPDRPDETPGFLGQLRILGSLVWGDLLSMLASQCAILEDLWPLAIDHPDQVYAGPLVPLVVKSWRVHNGIRGILMNQMMEYVKARVEGRAWPVTSTPAGNSSQRATTNATTTMNSNSGDDNGSNNTIRTPPYFPPELVPPADPVEANIRRHMLFQFARYLRRNGQTEQAIIVEQVIRAPRGELPDMDEVQRRMELEGITPGETRSAPLSWQGQGQDQEEDEGCPMQ